MDKDELIKTAALYYVNNKSTIRDTGAMFGYSKSWVVRVFKTKLKYISPELYEKVKEVTKENLSKRHLRGGEATKIKYKNMQILCKES